MDNKRLYPRQSIKLQIQLYFLQDAPRDVYSRDISDGGTFVELDEPQHYPLGELVRLSFDDPMHGNRYTEKDAVVVRVADDGIAAAFIEMCSF